MNQCRCTAKRCKCYTCRSGFMLRWLVGYGGMCVWIFFAGGVAAAIFTDWPAALAWSIALAWVLLTLAACAGWHQALRDRDRAANESAHWRRHALHLQQKLDQRWP